MYLKQMHLLSFHKLHFRISCFGWSWNGHGHGIHGALKNKMFATTYMLHIILPSLLQRLKGFDWAQNKRKSSIRTLVNFTLLLIWVVCVVGRLKDELNTNIELISHLMQWEQDDNCNMKWLIQDNLNCIIFIVIIVIGFLRKLYF